QAPRRLVEPLQHLLPGVLLRRRRRHGWWSTLRGACVPGAGEGCRRLVASVPVEKWITTNKSRRVRQGRGAPRDGAAARRRDESHGGGGTRTRTAREGQEILSLLRLPVSPLPRLRVAGIDADDHFAGAAFGGA